MNLREIEKRIEIIKKELKELEAKKTKIIYNARQQKYKLDEILKKDPLSLLD